MLPNYQRHIFITKSFEKPYKSQLLLSLDVRCTSEVKLHNSQKNINEG